MRRSTKAERQTIVAAYQASDLTQREFSQRHGICLSTLSRFLRESRTAEDAGRHTALIPVHIEPASPAGGGVNELTLEHASGWALHFTVGADAAYVAELITRLDEAAAC